ncbi:Gti1/Pac2 family domain-containing protein [Trichoderma pleuroticola]
MASQSPLNPTFKGHVATTWDALLLFEACLQGQINHVPRRPHDRERQELISSGNIFIYEEHASGIKRWTDGISWSPSRILGNFLIYRELDKPFPPGEKKRALKRKRGSQGVNKATPRSNSTVLDPATIARDPERSLVGSLVDSYLFKERGLVKKTISITFQGVPHHLVSYYSIEDVDNKSLVTPSESSFFQNLKPRTELIMSQNFRNPVDDVTVYGQDDNGFLTNSQFYAMGAHAMGAHVAEFSPHSHVADYGSQAMMSQALPVSAMAVAPHVAYSRAEYDYLGQQHPARDHFEAQVEAQVEAQARYAHRHHSFQYHDHLQQGQVPQDSLHHQQIQQQQQQMHHQQQLQRQQQLQHQMHAMQLQQQQQQQQQQFHHQMQQPPQPDEQRQSQLPQPSPHQQESQQDEQPQNSEEYSWSYGSDLYYAQ